MGLVSQSAASRHEAAEVQAFRTDEPERPIGPARGIFYAMVFGAAIWLVVLGGIEGVRLLLHP